MNQGQTTIIIPTPQFNPGLPSLKTLAACNLDPAHYEIIVAEGENPSRQRNLAFQKANGEFLLFLDSDCRVDLDYFAHLKAQIASVEFDVLGGPVLLPPDAPPLQQVFQAAVTDPLVSRQAASRYSARGALRPCDESELILCNLAVRAEFFRQSGGFNEALYPNEENEWLDRVTADARVFYDPNLQAHRYQRETWPAFMKMLIRYGIGRTQQLLASRKFNMKQLPALLILIWMALLVTVPLVGAAIGVAVAVLFVPVAATAQPPEPGVNRYAKAFAELCVVFFYAAGQIIGFFPNLPGTNKKDKIRLLDEKGEPIK